MSKKKGKGASPAKHVPQARPLLVTEILTLCGGNTFLAGQLLNAGAKRCALGKQDYCKFIMKELFKDDKIINGMGREKFFKQIDENKATRVLRHVAKRMAARQVQQAQPAA